MLELLKELLHRLSDVRALVALGGMVMVCGIVFVETGLFVGFFLPGDSLLVTAGVVAADKASGLQLAWLLPLVTLCAITGDQLGYWIGRTMGQRLYNARTHASSRRATCCARTRSMKNMARAPLSSRASCPSSARSARQSPEPRKWITRAICCSTSSADFSGSGA